MTPTHGSGRFLGVLAIALAGGSSPGASLAQEPAGADTTPEALAELSLEELARIDVVSVSRHEEPLASAAAAITVVSRDDIRRSGATLLPEMLRMVPGVHVSRSRANRYVVASRGALGQSDANKLLARIDGRSVYSPVFSGIEWARHWLMPEDIDRIEVIRGPGSSVWGANAVNGIVNVVTKPSGETQGLRATGGLGILDTGDAPIQSYGAARAGLELADGAYVRVYGGYQEEGPSELEGGDDARDRWHRIQGGFRSDADLGAVGRLTFQGDMYETIFNATTLLVTPPTNSIEISTSSQRGGNVLARWTKGFGDGGDVTVQALYDRVELHTLEETKYRDEVSDVGEVDAQHRVSLADWSVVTWGLGYRITAHRPEREPLQLSYDPPGRTTDVVSGFVQIEADLVPDSLALTLGSKLEHNDFSGYEVQPTVRLALTPASGHAIWGAVTRAVRVPSRVEQDGRLDQAFVPPGAVVALTGDDDFDAEDLLSFEAGYRALLGGSVSLDVAGFVNLYEEIRALRPGAPGPDPLHPGFLLVPFEAVNGLHGRSWGGEVALAWQALSWMRWQAGYSYLGVDLTPGPGIGSAQDAPVEGSSPRHMASLRTALSPLDDVEADLRLRYVGEVDALDVRPYLEMDARVAWSPTEHLTLSLVGSNLLESGHVETNDVFAPPGIRIEVPRSIGAFLTVKF